MTELVQHVVSGAWPDWGGDELGPRSVTIFRLPGEFRAVVAVDNVTLGPAIGGVRMRPEVTPDVLNRATAAQVRASIVLEGANIPATLEAEQMFAARNVLVVPDIIANAGGVICAAAESRGLTAAQAFADITERLRAAMTEWLARTESGEAPRNAARTMAQERLQAATAYRRTF
jgi:glutamate dehydrogenase/leucine dehydrogenase